MMSLGIKVLDLPIPKSSHFFSVVVVVFVVGIGIAFVGGHGLAIHALRVGIERAGCFLEI